MEHLPGGIYSLSAVKGVEFHKNMPSLQKLLMDFYIGPSSNQLYMLRMWLHFFAVNSLQIFSLQIVTFPPYSLCYSNYMNFKTRKRNKIT